MFMIVNVYICMSLLHSWSGYISPHQLVYPSTTIVDLQGIPATRFQNQSLFAQQILLQVIGGVRNVPHDAHWWFHFGKSKTWQNMAKHGKTWQNHQHPTTAFWITSQKTWSARLALCWKEVLVCIAQGQPAGFLHTFTWQVIMMRWMEEILHQVIDGLHIFILL